jgi:L(+)-tartrate dehydratase beta subunit
MSTTTLQTPISGADVEGLSIGDIIYLDGYLVTARDEVHLRLLKQNRRLPVDLAGGAIFHAGPIMKEREDAPGRYEVVSIGPTTSMRMEAYEKEFIGRTGLRLIVGKGGMGPQTAEGCRDYKAIHAVFPGGCAVLAATRVDEVESVEWLDLGMPEALWVLRVKRFGPLIVSIDTRGKNLFEQNRRAIEVRKNLVVEEICRHVDYFG